MGKIVVDSYAKINLGLDVINRRDDGYHNISTIMQEISLKDSLTIGTNDGKNINIMSNENNIPLNEDNLVYKAWELMKERSGIESGIDVTIDKRIPVAAGLAGGSTNAAAMLKGLNRLWELNYRMDELESIGEKIGADVPFCLRGGTLLARGIGNVFEEIRPFKDRDILLINPRIPMDTKRVYENLSLDGADKFNMDRLIGYVNSGDTLKVSENLYNKLEDVVLKEESIVSEIKDDLISNKALGSLMSGSGTSVFGIFKNESDLDYAYKRLVKKYPEYIVIKTKTL